MREIKIRSIYSRGYDRNHSKLSVVIFNEGGEYRVFSVIVNTKTMEVQCQRKTFNSFDDRMKGFVLKRGTYMAGSYGMWDIMSVCGDCDEKKAFEKCVNTLPRAYMLFACHNSAMRGVPVTRTEYLDDGEIKAVENAVCQFCDEMSMSDNVHSPDHKLLAGEEIKWYANGYWTNCENRSGFNCDEWKAVDPNSFIHINDFLRIYSMMKNNKAVHFRHVREDKVRFSDPVSIDGKEYALKKDDNGVFLYERVKSVAVKTQDEEKGEGGKDQGRTKEYMARIVNVGGLTEFMLGGLYRIKDGNKVSLNGKTYVTIYNDDNLERVIDEDKIKYELVYVKSPDSI